MDEKHPLNPVTSYAAGKAAADIMLQAYVKMFDLDSFIVRPFNNYGPRQNHEGPLAAVIPKTIFRILSGQTPIIQGTGKQTRDFIYVNDTISAALKLYSNIESGEAVNIAADGQIEIQELIKIICNQMTYTGALLIEDGRKADVQCHRADLSRLNERIKMRFTSLEKGIIDTICWYRENI
jgi:UDP-glucose 4-epimerase